MARATLSAWILVAFVQFLLPSATSAQQPAAGHLDRFLNRHDVPVLSYRAIRRMEARNERMNAEGWLEVLTELSPEHGLRFEVLREGGFAYIRNRVLRAALKREAQAIENGDPGRAAPTRANYEFIADATPSADGLLRVLARPKRKDVLLVEGVFFLDEDGELVRVEGELTKSPSFWTHDVRIVRHYRRVAGARVPVSLESTAKVRIAGESSLTVSYQYERVNDQVVASGVARSGPVQEN